MYVYIESEHNLWTVGFYDTKGNWHPDSDHESKESAREQVHYLNGGEEPENPYILHGKELEMMERKL